MKSITTRSQDGRLKVEIDFGERTGAEIAGVCVYEPTEELTVVEDGECSYPIPTRRFHLDLFAEESSSD